MQDLFLASTSACLASGHRGMRPPRQQHRHPSLSCPRYRPWVPLVRAFRPACREKCLVGYYLGITQEGRYRIMTPGLANGPSACMAAVGRGRSGFLPPLCFHCAIADFHCRRITPRKTRRLKVDRDLHKRRRTRRPCAREIRESPSQDCPTAKALLGADLRAN